MGYGALLCGSSEDTASHLAQLVDNIIGYHGTQALFKILKMFTNYGLGITLTIIKFHVFNGKLQSTSHSLFSVFKDHPAGCLEAITGAGSRTTDSG